MRALTLAAITSFAVCGLGVDDWMVAIFALRFMGASPLLLPFWCAACDIHAERLLAKAGGSNCKGRGITHPWDWSEAGVERAERSGGLHKRSAEAWGHPLRARGAKLPLAAFAVVFKFCFSIHQG